MVNPFLSGKNYDTDTALLFEKAYITDIGNAVAFTDGDRVFINTPDNLYDILPDYNDDMLFVLLWHEQLHKELMHPIRYRKFLQMETASNLTHNEVNIIMDILVHDWIANNFPDKVEIAKRNLAQFRDQNSLEYTFTTHTLEEMLKEYSEYKSSNEDNNNSTNTKDTSNNSDDKDSNGNPMPMPDDNSTQSDTDSTKSDTDTDTDDSTQSDDNSTQSDTNDTTNSASQQQQQPQQGNHGDTDWSELNKIDTKEFIDHEEADRYIDTINKIRNTKIRLAQIAQTLNGLVTTTKIRTYRTPNYAQTGQHTIFKGNQKGKTSLYLIFDASGSMGGDMELFKEIISKSIPQALQCPCEWFAGKSLDPSSLPTPHREEDYNGGNYYKATFKDFLPIKAHRGFGDDGDRTIELCLLAEQQGYSPIAVTDGGYDMRVYNKQTVDRIKALKRTVLVGQYQTWLNAVKEINPLIQTICTRGVSVEDLRKGGE